MTKSERYLLKNHRLFVLDGDIDSDDKETSDDNFVDNLEIESKYLQTLIEGTRLKQIGKLDSKPELKQKWKISSILGRTEIKE